MPHIYGVHPVIEALKAGTVRRLRVAGRAGDRLREVTELAAAAGIRTAGLGDAVPPIRPCARPWVGRREKSFQR